MALLSLHVAHNNLETTLKCHDESQLHGSSRHNREFDRNPLAERGRLTANASYSALLHNSVLHFMSPIYGEPTG